VCIVGKNGKGKTTLLKLLSGILENNVGSLVENPGVVKGVFEQTNIQTLDDRKTIEEELLYSHNDVTMQLARNIAGSMMFEGDAALKKISVLSGGEKSRVMLGKLLVTPVNLLMLDEPTNHLDLESCDSLLSAIDNFGGAVVMVTHNEMFLHAIATRLIVFKNDSVFLFEGSYEEFLEKEGWDDSDETDTIDSDTNQENNREKSGKKEVRKLRSAIISRRSKELKPIETRIKKTEAEIEEYENVQAELNEQLLAVSAAGGGDKIQEIAKSLHDKKVKIDDLYEKLEELTDLYDQKNSVYEEELSNPGAL
jgi:ATP-binding cassette subfamily F protein 3